MEPERWAQIKQIVNACLELKPEERKDAIRTACGGDLTLMVEVEGLLDSYEHMGGFFDIPTEGVTTLMQSGDEVEAVVDHYRLLQKVGEGGMGEVWLAEQQEPIRRRVALKLIKVGMDTREVVARFESERQALALMDHPAIAKVFDAGSTPQGRPYFVMEYVAGVPFTDYCDRHRLSMRERLELFVRVCEGVQHAHQKAIIHRDLKPSNILVTDVDGRATPKIIDFGVAKALTQKLTAETLSTRVGVLVGTPEYMSPEQALSSGEDIDIRTDIYSLGIIFYEMLAGVPPIELRRIAFDEFLRRLREDDPQKPSTKIRTQDQVASMDVARKRQTEPLTLAKQMRGDLDSIALKALEKDRSRRYGSLSEFAGDIVRYLKNEPVLAVAPSVAYLARKFARRHRGPLLTACAMGLALIVAAVISIRQSMRANEEAVVARREAAVAQAVNAFLRNDLLAQASVANQSGVSAKPDPDLKVRTALDRAAMRISGKFEGQPEVEAAIRDTIGQTYMDLGVYPEARTHLERSLELHRRDLGAANPMTLKTIGRLGRIADLQGRYPQAESLFRQALENQRRVLGAEHPDTLVSMNGLASVYFSLGKYVQAEALDSQTREIRRRVLGAEHADTLASNNDLAVDYQAEGKYPEAETLDRETLDIRRRVLGLEHPATLNSMNNLAIVYFLEAKYAQAEVLYSQTLEIRRRMLGSEHPYTLSSMHNLATAYYYEGKYPQAEQLHTQTLEIERRVLGPEHRETLTSMNNLAAAYAAQGKYLQAEALSTKTIEISRRVLGPEHPLTLDFLAEFAFQYQRVGKYALAETYSAQSLAGRRHALGPENSDTMATAANLALAYLTEGKFAQSEALARQSLEFYRNKLPDDWQRFRAESLIGASLAGEKKYTEAEPLLFEGYQGMVARKDRMTVPDWYHAELAREWIVQFYRARGMLEKARELEKNKSLTTR